MSMCAPISGKFLRGNSSRAPRSPQRGTVLNSFLARCKPPRLSKPLGPTSTRSSRRTPLSATVLGSSMPWTCSLHRIRGLRRATGTTTSSTKPWRWSEPVPEQTNPMSVAEQTNPMAVAPCHLDHRSPVVLPIAIIARGARKRNINKKIK